MENNNESVCVCGEEECERKLQPLGSRRPATTMERTMDIFKVGSKLTFRHILYRGSRCGGVAAVHGQRVSFVGSICIQTRIFFKLL
jgi:hypothetical protein